MQFHCVKISQYFPKPYEPFGGDIKVKVDLSNYATKAGIKNILHVDTSSFALKTNLASLKIGVDKLDIDKLLPVSVDVSKLSDVVKNDVVKKNVYGQLVAKVDNIDTGRFVLKTKYDADKSELENKIPDTSGIVKKTEYNSKSSEIKAKIPDVSNLLTKTALTTFENKIPSVNSLVKKMTLKLQKLKIPDTSGIVKKTEYNSKSSEIKAKIPDVNNLLKKLH